MATTTNILVGETEGWTLVASSPAAITLKSNAPPWMDFAVAIAGSLPAVDFVGEQHPGGTSWESQGFIGNLYVKAYDEAHQFAVTI